MRGSIDRCPGSKLAVKGASHTNAKKFNRVQTIEQRKNATSQKSAAGARRVPNSGASVNKGVRTKSSVSGAGATLHEMASSTTHSVH